MKEPSLAFTDLKNERISVLVPVYNEGNRLIENLALLESELKPHFSNYEIIVISDGSTDSTNEILSTQNLEHVRSIILEKNHGKGFAIKRGFYEATGQYILFIDGGMELHPKEIRVFLGLMLIYDADIVIGSKRHPQSQLYYPIYRRFLSAGYQSLVKLFFNLDVTDTQVGIKLFRKPVVDAIKEKLSIDKYGFDLELLCLAQYSGFTKILEAPVRLDYFDKNIRKGFSELFHVAKVTWAVLADSIQVYRKIKKLRRSQKNHVENIA